MAIKCRPAEDNSETACRHLEPPDVLNKRVRVTPLETLTILLLYAIGDAGADQRGGERNL